MHMGTPLHIHFAATPTVRFRINERCFHPGHCLKRTQQVQPYYNGTSTCSLLDLYTGASAHATHDMLPRAPESSELKVRALPVRVRVASQAIPFTDATTVRSDRDLTNTPSILGYVTCRSRSRTRWKAVQLVALERLCHESML